MLPTMQLFVQTTKTYTLDFAPNDKIHNLKAKIQDKTGIASKHQRLMFQGKQLKGDGALSQYNITNLCVINVMPSISSMSTRTSITLTLHLTDILQFVPNQKTSLKEMNCDENTSIDSVLKELDITYLAESLRMDFYNMNIQTKSSYIYSQIVDKPLFNIGDIINKQTNTIELSLHFVFKISQKIILNTQFLEKMTKYFENNKPDKHNAFALDVILQIISLMASLKSNNVLLYKSALCLSKFSNKGLPKAITKDNVYLRIIPAILKILKYRDDDNDSASASASAGTSGYMDKIRPLLVTSMINIATKGKNNTEHIHFILNELTDLVDPCQDRDCLSALCQFYVGVWNSSIRLNRRLFNKIIQQLHILIFYEDEIKTLYSILRAYYGLIGNRRYRNLFNIENAISESDSKLIVEKYLNKVNENRLIFNAFIYETVSETNIKYVPSDIALVMFKFFDCYANINSKHCDIIWRMLQFMDKSNGYLRMIKHSVWNIAKKFIPPLSVLSDTFSSHCNDETSKVKVYNVVSKYGVIDGLLFIMDDMIPSLEMINNETDKCCKCNVSGNCDCWKNSAKYENMDGLLAKILDIIEYLFRNDAVQDIIVQKLTSEKGTNLLKKIQQIGSKCIGEQQLSRVIQLLDASPFYPCDH